MAIANEKVLYDGLQNADCADEESTPVELHSPSESLPCSSPLRVAPSEGASILIGRDNNSMVCDYMYAGYVLEFHNLYTAIFFNLITFLKFFNCFLYNCAF